MSDQDQTAEIESTETETSGPAEESVLYGLNAPQDEENSGGVSTEEKNRRLLYQQYMQQEQGGKTKGVAVGFTAAAAGAAGAGSDGGAGFKLPSSSSESDGGYDRGYHFRMARKDLARYNTDKYCHARVNRHLHRAIKEGLDNGWNVMAFNRGGSDRRDDLVSMYLAQRVQYLARSDTRDTRRILRGMGYEPEEARARLAGIAVDYSPAAVQKELRRYSSVIGASPPPMPTAPVNPMANWAPPKA